jgi:RNase P subunit RPR2
MLTNGQLLKPITPLQFLLAYLLKLLEYIQRLYTKRKKSFLSRYRVEIVAKPKELYCAYCRKEYIVKK